MTEPVHDLHEFDVQTWDELILAYGSPPSNKSGGVKRSGDHHIRLHCGMDDGTTVHVPDATFDRLVRAGLICADGSVTMNGRKLAKCAP